MTAPYQPIPLPDRVQKPDDQALACAQAFLDDMRRRHSVRDFDTRPVPEAVIAACVAAAGTAPSGANKQPWHFTAISDPAIKAQIRAAAEEEERAFYSGGGGEEWLAVLAPLGTHDSKQHITDAPWLIVIFAERYSVTEDETRYKNYYVPESVGIATGILITALHQAGLVCLTHTPSPMKFLAEVCARPLREKPVMILHVGWPAADATVPAAAKVKKPLDEILSVFRG